MTDSWSEALGAALASGDPQYMQAMLADVPSNVLSRAAPYIAAMGRLNTQQGKLEAALTCYDQLIRIAPETQEWYQCRAEVLLVMGEYPRALADARRLSELDSQHAVAYQLQARALEGAGELQPAIEACRRALTVQPNTPAVVSKIAELENVLRKRRLAEELLGGGAPGQSAPAVAALSNVDFDPAWLLDSALPPTFDQAMVNGVRQHLRRYGQLQSSKDVMTRIEDQHWLAMWDRALAATAGTTIVCHGSELGLLPLRAVALGATRVIALESSPLDQRLCAGVVQKNRLIEWQGLQSASEAASSQAEKEVAFESFCSNIQVLPADSPGIEAVAAHWFVFANFDHTLLGTGLVPALRSCRPLLGEHVRVLPGKARIFAMGIRWRYPGTPVEHERVQQLRWSPYPSTLDVGTEAWSALTESICVGEIDFAHFVETVWECSLPVHTAGRLDGIVFWFELELGEVRISTAPDSELRCIRPAVQYTDPIQLTRASAVPLRVQVTSTRLNFQTQPAASLLRSAQLPSWYVPMLLDQPRNAVYELALVKALRVRSSAIALDIGAGFGLLSMLAARAGAEQVYGCEIRPAIHRVGAQIVAEQYGQQIKLIDKDCRQLRVPEDLPRRADLVIFEMFDCSLLGEGVLHFLAYSREHLLAPDARYLPLTGRIRAMVIEYRLDRLLGLDVNLLNPYRYSPSFINVDSRQLDYRQLTEPFDVFAFDFATATPAPQEIELKPTVCRDGVAGAVLFWFDIQLDADTWLSNAPGADPMPHWRQALQFLPEVRFTGGGSMPLQAKHDGSALSFTWRNDELQPDCISKLPRFDVRWRRLADELDLQTEQLLQHCMTHPQEYAKVAHLAALLAIDPAAHGLSAKIAQRFASTFFSN